MALGGLGGVKAPDGVLDQGRGEVLDLGVAGLDVGDGVRVGPGRVGHAVGLRRLGHLAVPGGPLRDGLVPLQVLVLAVVAGRDEGPELAPHRAGPLLAELAEHVAGAGPVGPHHRAHRPGRQGRPRVGGGDGRVVPLDVRDGEQLAGRLGGQLQVRDPPPVGALDVEHERQCAGGHRHVDERSPLVGGGELLVQERDVALAEVQHAGAVLVPAEPGPGGRVVDLDAVGRLGHVGPPLGDHEADEGGAAAGHDRPLGRRRRRAQQGGHGQHADGEHGAERRRDGSGGAGRTGRGGRHPNLPLT